MTKSLSFHRLLVASSFDTPTPYVGVVDEPIDVSALIARVSGSSVGAISLFLGTVRDVHDGRAVTGIEYSAYRTMAAQELHTIATEVCLASPGLRLVIEHRLGVLRVSDVSVAIVASHARRAPALDATRAVIEALKQRVPIWKLEYYADGERAWVDPTGSSASR